MWEPNRKFFTGSWVPFLPNHPPKKKKTNNVQWTLLEPLRFTTQNSTSHCHAQLSLAWHWLPLPNSFPGCLAALSLSCLSTHAPHFFWTWLSWIPSLGISVDGNPFICACVSKWKLCKARAPGCCAIPRLCIQNLVLLLNFEKVFKFEHYSVCVCFLY